MSTDSGCQSLSRKTVWLMQLLMTTLVECDHNNNNDVLRILIPPYVDIIENYKSVAYRDVLRSTVRKIVSDIKQQFEGNGYVYLSCDHYPVNVSDSTKTVVFVWAIDKETHEMSNCLRQEMQKFGRIAQEIHRHGCKLLPTIEFCHRTATVKTRPYDRVLAVNIYVSGPENDERIPVTGEATMYDSDIVGVTSKIRVRPLNVGNHVRTYVCNSVQLNWNKTGKLRQRFFSIVGYSPEVIVKSSRTASANVNLYFDVLAINVSRLGLLDGSKIELYSLSDLQVSCMKLDEYGLSNETLEITEVNTTKERSVTTKALIVENTLRIQVNVFIPAISDHSFGDYLCETVCKLQVKNSQKMISSSQFKYFSIVDYDWRYAHMTLAAQMEINKILTIDVIALLITILVIGVYGICKKVLEKLKIRSDLKAFTVVQSVLQSTEHSCDRAMKYDVFLSYSSKDRPWVQSKLLNFIENKGFKVCFDERDFPPGCSLVESIGRAVYESDKVIAVVSPNYLSSRWCVEYEFVLTYTKILNKEAPSNSLLLIKYRNCQMPDSMSCLKYLDYTRTMTSCDSRNILMKVLNYVFPSCQNVDVGETPNQKQFFHDLLMWLEKPHIGKQCSVIKSSAARKKRLSRKRQFCAQTK